MLILEVGCTFDHSLEEAFSTKILKYQQLEQAISQLGYRCKLLVFIFGSLGHAHKFVVRGLQMAGLSKIRAKQLAKYCSYLLLLVAAQYGEGGASCTHELDTVCFTVRILYLSIHCYHLL